MVLRVLLTNKNSPEAVKRTQPSKVETTGNVNLLITTVSDIRLQPSIDHAKHKAS